jgi:nucleoid-associated protein YgaU
MQRYQNNVKILKEENGVRFYSSAIPVDPLQEELPFEYTSRIGDRWDSIASKYLGNPSLWYVIAAANNSLNGSIFIKPGTVIIIPET